MAGRLYTLTLLGHSDDSDEEHLAKVRELQTHVQGLLTEAGHWDDGDTLVILEGMTLALVRDADAS